MNFLFKAVIAALVIDAMTSRAKADVVQHTKVVEPKPVKSGMLEQWLQNHENKRQAAFESAQKVQQDLQGAQRQKDSKAYAERMQSVVLERTISQRRKEKQRVAAKALK